ncbi:MAG: polymer-forming cytoskeletal protein [Pseudomonadota bacterium]|nr:polymer-forming cytoskeletal protein [Pseudomonadota bacterium]
MFGRKRDEREEGGEDATESAIAAVSKTPSQNTARSIRPAMSPPEVSRRTQGIHDIAGRRTMQNSGDEGKKLIVGRDIALNGEIKSCDKLVVEGHVEANISDCRIIEIAEGGSFKGMAEIDTAEISGVFDGSITARELLVVRATGRITGKVRFGQLEIERGGEIAGDVQAYGPGEARNAPTPIVADVPAE